MAFLKQTRGDMVWYEAENLRACRDITHGFSTRLGGVSEGYVSSLNLRGTTGGDTRENVMTNYQRLSKALSMTEERRVLSHQVHRDDVYVVTEKDCGKGFYVPWDFEADALITKEKHLPLTVFSADCIIILLYDPEQKAVGAVHAGWRGTSLQILRKTVEEMGNHFGTRPEQLRAAIGPGICTDCFETMDDVHDAMLNSMGAEAEPFLHPFGSKWKIDLKGLNRRQLELLGVKNIAVCELCTACHPELFWSHRKMGDRRGVQCATISLR